MPITSIDRYFVGNPNIVGIVTSDNLATITSADYWKTQLPVVSQLINGTFEWTISDLILMYYATNQIGFFTYDPINLTFIETAASAGNYVKLAPTTNQLIAGAYSLGANNLLPGFLSITSNGTTPVSLTSASPQVIQVTGNQNQTIVMPNVTTLTSLTSNTTTYTFLNKSSSTVTINSSGGNLIASITPNSIATLYLVANTGTDATPWVVNYINLSGSVLTAPAGNQTITGNFILSLYKLNATNSIVTPILQPSSGFNGLTLTNASISSVNYFNMTNAVSGGWPIFQPAGLNANIGINFTMKGTGVPVFKTTAASKQIAVNIGSASNLLTFPIASSTTSEYIFPTIGTGSATLATTSDLTGFVELVPASDQVITNFGLQVAAGSISSGDVNIGGYAGNFVAYAFTANKGSLQLTCIDNVGDFDNTIKNTPTTAPRTYTLPNASGNILLDTQAVLLNPAADQTIVSYNLIVGAGGLLTGYTTGTATPAAGILETVGISIDPNAIISGFNSNVPLMTLRASAAAAPGSFTALTPAQSLGAWQIQGDDGTSFVDAGAMVWTVGSTVSTGNVPSTCVLYTSNTSGGPQPVWTADYNQNFTVNLGSLIVPSGVITIGAGGIGSGFGVSILQMYSPTALFGLLNITSPDNTGDYVNTLSNTPTTADRQWTFPDATGTIVLQGQALKTFELLDLNGNAALVIAANASAVNYIAISNVPTGNSPVIAAGGSDTNISLSINAQGTGIFEFLSAATTNQILYNTGTTYQHNTYFNFADTAQTRTVTFQDATGTLCQDNSGSGSITTAPPASAAATLALGSAYQNTAGYDVVVTVYLAVSAATTASILSGVGPTNTPTQQTIVSGLTLAALNVISVTLYIPAGYYALLSTSGTITATISGQQAMAV